MKLRDMQAAVSIGLLLMSFSAPQGIAQQTNPPAPAPVPVSSSNAQAGAYMTPSGALPQAPDPKLTEPLFLLDTGKNYANPKSHIWKFWAPYTPTDYPLARLGNTDRLQGLIRDGKIYLGLADAVALALDNNFDIAIARINLDIADTDILRAKAGSGLRGVSSGLVTGTLGGTTSTVTGGGGPGGTSTAVGGSGTGAGGLVLSTNGLGPIPEALDPVLTGTLQYESAQTQQTSTLVTGTNSLNQSIATYDFGYAQGFLTGTALNVGFNNARTTTNSVRNTYSPQFLSTFRVTATQHLLQGFGPNLNGRFVRQAKNDRRITDSSFRQQLLFSINQVENIYWGLVSAYEDEQAKERALAQSTQLAADNRKQLEIGTLAPLDVVNSDSAVATDRQALVAAKSNLEYQQLIIKQAIARDLNGTALENAPVIPTDRIGLDRLPEEDMSAEDLVKQAYINNPQIEQAVLNMKNNEITIKAEKNGLLPTVDAYAFYGASSLGGSQNPALQCTDPITFQKVPCTGANAVTPIGYGGVFTNLFNNTSPDKGVGVNINIPIRNRTAQADQERSQMEYRQAQMRLQQLYIQIKVGVINGQYALTNDRAQVVAAQAARDYAAQSLDAEEKKYRLGASTTALVLQQARNQAIAEDTLISAIAVYAKDRAALEQLLANTLDRYGISLVDSAKGIVSIKPVVPGLTAPTPPAPPKPLTVNP